MVQRRRAKATLVAAAAAVVLAFGAPSYAQIFEGTTTTTAPSSTTTAPTTTTTSAPSSTTTTSGGLLSPSSTAPGSTTTTTAPSAGGSDPFAPGDGATPAPDGATDGGGDGEGADGNVPRTVPPEAQAIINSVRRSPANSSAKLLAAVDELVRLGLSRDEAVRIGFGRFPIAGEARYSHDWLFPRYGPGFRFHLGTDVFAPFGTPLRSPVDGTVTSGSGSLGGLYVKIFMEDGTYFYYAHMAGLVDGFTEGMAIKTGDIVGYVGDSGNAKGGSPHLHIGVYPQGGPAVDPKPILDQFLADALAQLPQIVEQVRAQRTGASASAATPAEPRPPRSLLGTALLRPLTDRLQGNDVPTEVLYQTSGAPSAGGLSVAEIEAGKLAASVDWQQWSQRERVREDIVANTEAAFRLALGPLAPAR